MRQVHEPQEPSRDSRRDHPVVDADGIDFDAGCSWSRDQVGLTACIERAEGTLF